MKLDLYEANADYIAYLRQFDPNVLTDKICWNVSDYSLKTILCPFK